MNRSVTDGDMPDGDDFGANVPLDDAFKAPPPIPLRYRNRQDVLRRSGPPPLVDPNRKGDWSAAASTQTEILAHLETTEREFGGNAKQESAGWLSSVLVHLGFLLLIALLVAPSDLGGHGTRTLRFRFTEDDGDLFGQTAPIEVVAVEMKSQPNEMSTEPEAPEEPEAQNEGISDPLQTETSESDLVSGGAKNSDASHGSFFGINASGHEFVYVLDMSGSMKGLRFRRAADELVRSVERLNESQKFYVVLFSDSATQLFGSRSIAPQSLNATRQNKNRLRKWLNSTAPTGGTDPRPAIHLALQMNPNAVFMLSDGEFQDKKNKRWAMFGSSGDTYSVVAAHSANTPIHAIAYEDPKSCKNMERLSQMTDGEYRYVKYENFSEVELLDAAKIAISLPTPDARAKHLGEIATDFLRGKATETSRLEFAEILSDAAIQMIKDEQFNNAENLFVDWSRVAPKQAKDDSQTLALVQAFIGSSTPSNENFSTNELLELAGRVPGSAGAERFKDAVAKRLYEEGLRLTESGSRFQAYDRFAQVVRKFPQADVAKACRTECEKAEKQIQDFALQLRNGGNAADSIKYLRGMVVRSRATSLKPFVLEMLKNKTLEMLAQARDLGTARDISGRAEIYHQLSTGYQLDPLLVELRKQFNRREDSARESLGKAVRLRNDATQAAARHQFRETIEQYPNTLAAKRAREYLSSPKMVGSGKFDATESATVAH